jgi:membrane glycosyltransferase
MGVALGAVALSVSLYLALWMLPVVLGLALAIPLALWTGRRWAGARLLRTPEEFEIPPVLARAASLQREWHAEAAPDVAGLLHEPRLLEAHEAMLPPPRRPRIDPIEVPLLLGRTKLDEAETFESALAALTKPELTAVLGDAAALQRLSVLAAAA